MANVKISQLPTATSLSIGDLVPVVQGGITKQATPDLLPLSTAVVAALAAKADTTAIPTQPADIGAEPAGTAAAQIAALVGAAPDALNTLKEIDDQIAADEGSAAALAALVATKADAASVAATYVSFGATAPDHAVTPVWVDTSTTPQVVKGWSGTAWVAIGGGGGTVSDATATVKGVLQLAGDLAGTAAAPTVPGLTTRAPLDSPAFTGTPTVPTAAAGTNTTQAASTAFVAAQIAALVNAAPGALDTLKELADALGDDANYAATTAAALAARTKFRGEWTASTAYAISDVFTYLGASYTVTTAFTSGTTFSSSTNVARLSGPRGELAYAETNVDYAVNATSTALPGLDIVVTPIDRPIMVTAQVPFVGNSTASTFVIFTLYDVTASAEVQRTVVNFAATTGNNEPVGPLTVRIPASAGTKRYQLRASGSASGVTVKNSLDVGWINAVEV